MKAFVVFLMVLPLFGGALDLPVNYDPFYKASKIIKTAKKRKVLQRIPVQRLRLYAIFNDKAYINGRFYAIGDRIGEYKLVSIKKDYVLLSKKGTIKMLPLLKNSILRIGKR